MTQDRRGLWRRTTLEEFRKAKPAWETVLDLDALAKQEKENSGRRAAQFLRPENNLVLISLSRGADASVVREFDLAAKAFVKGGNGAAEAKSQLGWRGPGNIFVGTDFGPGRSPPQATRGSSRNGTRGTPQPICRGHLRGQARRYERVGQSRPHAWYKHDIVTRRPSFWTSESFLPGMGS